jgi:ATP-dependent exoDNAse (exonuclease V) beta subunit
MDYLKDECLAFDELKNREERLKGEVIHYMLSLVLNLEGVKTDVILEKALEETRRRFPGRAEGGGYLERLQSMAARQELRDVFYIKDGEVFNEREIVTAYGLTKRIDRMIIRVGEVMIVDYKSSRDRQDEYAAQVREYMDIVSGIYPDRNVRGYLLYLDEMLLEEVI